MVLHRDAGVVSTSSRCIQAGDLVIVYERFDSMKSVYVNPGESYGNRYGNFKLKDWVGKPFGSRVEASGRGATGWVYLLAPTPELWTIVLRHRTQILYVADISMICTFLELKPGCVVLESGTGSGSLTHSLARAVAPTGHVHTFEFHQPRAEAADKEFKEHGMGGVITTKQRNIEELGFPEDLHGKADGLFLDLPGPWHAVASAAQCLRPDGVFCAFSPCIEQVQRTCAALEEQSFFAVRTMECLLRQYEVRQEKIIALDDDLQGAQQLSGKRKRQENFQSRKRQAQTAPPGADVAIETAGVQDATAQPATSMATDDQLDQGVQASAALVMTRLAPKTELSGTTALPHDLSTNTMSLDRQLQQQMQGASSPWRAALANSPADSDHAVPSPIGQPDVQAVGASVNGQVKVQGVEKLAADHSGSKSGPQRCVVAKPVNEARGHTGYLTFARRSVDD